MCCLLFSANSMLCLSELYFCCFSADRLVFNIADMLFLFFCSNLLSEILCFA